MLLTLINVDNGIACFCRTVLQATCSRNHGGTSIQQRVFHCSRITAAFQCPRCSKYHTTLEQQTFVSDNPTGRRRCCTWLNSSGCHPCHFAFSLHLVTIIFLFVSVNSSSEHWSWICCECICRRDFCVLQAFVDDALDSVQLKPIECGFIGQAMRCDVVN